MPQTDGQRSSECPRCGYDLSGAVAAWPEDRCPMQSRCSECGLDVAWVDVLGPGGAERLWLIETAERRLARAWYRTAWLTLRPARLWSTLGMHHAFSPLRLALFLLIWLGGLWTLGSSVSIWMGLSLSVPFGGWDPLNAIWLWDQRNPWSWGGGSTLSFIGPPPVAIALALFVFMPAAYFLLPQTLHRARVRRRHILRIWAYSSVGIPITLLVPISAWYFTAWGLNAGFGMRWIPWPWIPPRSSGPEPWVAAACALVWLAWTWRCASRDYLKLPRPGLIAGLLMLTCILLLATIIIVGSLASSEVAFWVMDTLS